MGCCSSTSGGGDEFTREFVRAQNKYRAKHGAPAMHWDSKAAHAAQKWAEHLASTGRLQHGEHDGMGQNLAYKSGGVLTAQEVADMWYNEVNKYDFNNPGFSSSTGHFTQMVWAESTHIGIGRAQKGNTTYAVANYVPPGNVQGRENYQRNVKPAN